MEKIPLKPGIAPSLQLKAQNAGRPIKFTYLPHIGAKQRAKGLAAKKKAEERRA